MVASGEKMRYKLVISAGIRPLPMLAAGKPAGRDRKQGNSRKFKLQAEP
jgi:hypothetical protein